MKNISFLTILLLGLLVGCKKNNPVSSCFTCTSFVTYASNSSTFKTPAPYNYDNITCDESEKVKYEKGNVKVESITGTTSLTTTTRTVCYPRL